MLEDSVPGDLGQQPELRHHFHVIDREGDLCSLVDFRLPLAEAIANPAEPARLAIGQIEANRDLLAENLFEGDLRGRLGQHVHLKMEETRDALVAVKAGDQQRILPSGVMTSRGRFAWV